MMGNESVSYAAAFFAGVLTYLSPCFLPLIPSFVAYITGVSFADLADADKKAEIRGKAVSHSLLFILGFSIVFILAGLTATFIGKALFRYQNIIRIGGGVFIILFGLYLIGILKLDFLAKEWRLKIPAKSATYLGSFLIGVTFAAAWTPCAGPILGSILVLAGTRSSAVEGAGLLALYSLGIAIPFFFTALAVNAFLAFLNRYKKFIGALNIVAGVFLIIVGILVASGYKFTL